MTFQGTGIPEAGTLMTDREVARPGTRGGDASPRLAGPGRLALLAGSVTALVSASLAGSALGFLSKEACRAGAWNVGIEQYQAHCYTDIYPLYFSEGLSAGKVPYLGHPVEYPVIIGAAMQAAAWVVSPISDVFIRGREFFDVTVILLTLCTVAAVLATAYLAGPSRRWTALLVALSPAVILAAFINWDLIAMSLATLGMAAWAGRRGVLAGVLLGLAVATKFYPVFLLGPLLLLCLRAGRLRAFWVTACAAAATWLAVNLPVAIAAPAGWSRFYLFNASRGADWGSIWYFFETEHWPIVGSMPLGTLNAVSLLLFGIACVLIAVLALAAPRRPRVPQLSPLVVLARPRLAAFALWQIAEIGYFLGIWAYLITIIAGPGAPGGIGTGPYFTTVLARFCTVALLAGLVVRDILHPQADVVRRDGADDPAGGVLSGAPDRFVLRLRLGLRQARAGALPPAPR
jgi:uncharacterized membrane protein